MLRNTWFLTNPPGLRYFFAFRKWLTLNSLLFFFLIEKLGLDVAAVPEGEL